MKSILKNETVLARRCLVGIIGYVLVINLFNVFAKNFIPFLWDQNNSMIGIAYIEFLFIFVKDFHDLIVKRDGLIIFYTQNSLERILLARIMNGFAIMVVAQISIVVLGTLNGYIPLLGMNGLTGWDMISKFQIVCVKIFSVIWVPLYLSVIVSLVMLVIVIKASVIKSSIIGNVVSIAMGIVLFIVINLGMFITSAAIGGYLLIVNGTVRILKDLNETTFIGEFLRGQMDNGAVSGTLLLTKNSIYMNISQIIYFLVCIIVTWAAMSLIMKKKYNF